ncbi:TrmH family RNA methyltransferase [Winogradskyella sediminis]|uniref:tRNA (guanosine(18)-2'-O)-methyltransferase n=1 Tax=Winogradskyella sediminis TaxID=1382466 RepID=A0A1H1N2D7_9FLAO|nr:RNA methyltransferase [Winogradskyella sediminis]SDR92865.1 tRNA (guanosine-2'-O-)-methyltransferase [Winogradskyella sediminis]
MQDLELLEYLETFVTSSRIDRFKAILPNRTKHFTVATEDVYQLHNTSAVMRTCDVFGIQELNIVEEVNSKSIDREIAMGAQKWVDLNRYHSIGDCISDIKSQGYQIVATTPHIDDCELIDFDITKKSCFFFGRESQGLSQQVLDEADCFLKIPMFGFTESLNISVSAAIILQHVTARLRKSDIKWQLTEEEIIDKRFDWIKKTIKDYDAIVERYNSKA